MNLIKKCRPYRRNLLRTKEEYREKGKREERDRKERGKRKYLFFRPCVGVFLVLMILFSGGKNGGNAK